MINNNSKVHFLYSYIFTTIHFSTVIHYRVVHDPALYILINTTQKNLSQWIKYRCSSKFFCKNKIVNSRWTGVFSSAQWGKKIFASKKIWFGNSRTNVFLGQNILFRLRIICTCCLYNKHACRKLDWSTSFKIHIRCQVFDKIPVWFWFFFWKFKFYLIPHVQW